MSKIKGAQSKPEKRDMLTEMFEHFGIKVVDVTPQKPNLNKNKIHKK